MNKKQDRILTIALWVLLVASVLPLLHYGRRALITDRFVIKGVSMEPTLHTGQGVWVNKLLMGPRIYTKFDFESPELHCIRLPGLRRLRVGDVAVFNYPYGRHGDTIAFKINYVYCKRCWGTPGDTVRIVDGRLEIPGQAGDDGRMFWDDGRMAGDGRWPRVLGEIPDSVLLERRVLRAGQFAGEGERWTIKDFGPIVVPKRGMTIVLDSVARRHYARVIDWEGRSPVKPGMTESVPGTAESVPGTAERGPAETYTFRQDWYFFVGDNQADSRDSRYFGFVPADFVVGIVPGF